MRRFRPLVRGLGAVVVILLCSGPLVNCECDEDIGGRPDLEVDATLMQFDDVAVGYPQTQILRITNMGRVGLVLDPPPAPRGGDQSPFSVLGAMFGDEIGDVPGSIAHLGSIDLVVQYDPASETAEDFDILDIATNDRDECPSDFNPCEVQLNGTGAPPNAELDVTCREEDTCPGDDTSEICWKVRDPATNTHPTRVVFNFCEVSVGEKGELAATLKNIGNIPLSMDGFEFDPAFGDPTDFRMVEPSATDFLLSPGQEQRLLLEYEPAEEGPDSAGMNIATNDSDLPDGGTFGVRLLGMSAAPNIDVNPMLIRFSEVAVGNSDVKQITIHNTGTGSLLVESMLVEGGTVEGEFSVSQEEPFAVEGSGQATFDLTYSPQDTSWDDGTLTITSNDPDEPVVVVTLEGGAFPDLEVNPQEMEFAGVDPGGSAEQEATLRNVGYADLTISSIDFSLNPGSPPVFELADLPADFPANPIVLAPGEAETFRIIFTDNMMIEDEAGQLEIVHDSPKDASPYNLLIMSSGTPANLPPVALINPPSLTIHGLQQISLDGSGSFDPDAGDSIAGYSWSFLFKPADAQGNPSQAVLDSTDQPQTTFTPDIYGTYVIRLVVFDTIGAPSRPTDAEVSVNP